MPGTKSKPPNSNVAVPTSSIGLSKIAYQDPPEQTRGLSLEAIRFYHLLFFLLKK